MKTRDVLLAAAILCGLVLATKAAQVSVTPEFWDWLATAGPALAQNAGVRVLVAVFGLCSVAWLVSVAVDAWKADRAQREAKRARARAIRAYRERNGLIDSPDTRTDSGRPAA